MDPFFDLEQFHTKDPVEEELSNEAASDEAVRREAAEQMLNNVMQPKWMEKDVLDGQCILFSSLPSSAMRHLFCPLYSHSAP